MKKYLCIHCHFYQPPRENPWLEQIEIQDLAFPFHDWNERINSECYAPNSASRILNKDNKIISIVNNYSNLSFNFGPTLLSWIEEKDPRSYQKILQADQESIKNHSGHGNAIAQAYNHIILPLAKKKDKITQIKWGLEDFKSRFNREPEGMWLPETAVNTETLELLADHNIKYTILSPFQAKKIKKIGGDQEKWSEVNHSIDPSQSYLFKLKNNRSINLFFYDAPISQAVAFEGLLADGGKFAHRLLMGYSADRKRDQLLNIATDGETYGHHFKFGEMALTYSFADLEENHNIHLTNYGEYMELYPPEYEVQIHENSSWSCFHGVERWQSDCGCKIGYQSDWNQSWRSPLRDSLNHLKNHLNDVFSKKGSAYLLDPWDARNGYIRIILNRNPNNVHDFFNNYQKRELSEQEKLETIQLLEMQRHGMLMFTSCGWFFDDISGIETVQILKHACRAIQIAQQFGYDLEKQFLKELSQSKSNIPEQKDGKNIYVKLVKPSQVDLKRVIAHHAITSLFSSNSKPNAQTLNQEKEVYSYSVKQEDFEKNSHGTLGIAIGKVQVTSNITFEREYAVFAALYLGQHDLQCKIGAMFDISEYAKMKHDLLDTFENDSMIQVIRKFDHYFSGDFFSLKDLFLEERRKLLNQMSKETFKNFERSYFKLYFQNKRLMDYHLEMDVPINIQFKKAAQFVLSKILYKKIVEETKVEGSYDYSKDIDHILAETKKWRVELDLGPVIKAITHILSQKINQLKENCQTPLLIDIIRFLHLTKIIGFPLNLWYLQNEFFTFYNTNDHVKNESSRVKTLLSEIADYLAFEV